MGNGHQIEFGEVAAVSGLFGDFSRCAGGQWLRGIADGIFFAHFEALVSLPPHHGDPFDRLIIAQAGHR